MNKYFSWHNTLKVVVRTIMKISSAIYIEFLLVEKFCLHYSTNSDMIADKNTLFESDKINTMTMY